MPSARCRGSTAPPRSATVRPARAARTRYRFVSDLLPGGHDGVERSVRRGRGPQLVRRGDGGSVRSTALLAWSVLLNPTRVCRVRTLAACAVDTRRARAPRSWLWSSRSTRTHRRAVPERPGQPSAASGGSADYNMAPTKQACVVLSSRPRPPHGSVDTGGNCCRRRLRVRAVRAVRAVTPSAPRPRPRSRSASFGCSPGDWSLAWSKTPTTGPRMINARAETVLGKGLRPGRLRRRCLVPADGWFEWQASPTARDAKGRPRKQPFHPPRRRRPDRLRRPLRALARPRGRDSDDPRAWLSTFPIHHRRRSPGWTASTTVGPRPRPGPVVRLARPGPAGPNAVACSSPLHRVASWAPRDGRGRCRRLERSAPARPAAAGPAARRRRPHVRRGARRMTGPRVHPVDTPPARLRVHLWRHRAPMACSPSGMEPDPASPRSTWSRPARSPSSSAGRWPWSSSPGSSPGGRSRPARRSSTRRGSPRCWAARAPGPARPRAGPVVVAGRSAGARVACRTAVALGASGVLAPSPSTRPAGPGRTAATTRPAARRWRRSMSSRGEGPLRTPDEVRAAAASPLVTLYAVAGTHTIPASAVSRVRQAVRRAPTELAG